MKNEASQLAIPFERSPQPMWIFDRRTLRFLAVNAAAVALYRYSRRRFLRMRLSDVVLGLSHDELLRAVGALGTRFRHLGVRRHRAADGSVLDVRVFTNAIRYSGAPARLSMLVDVTAETRSEQLRAEAESYWRLLLSQAPEFITCLDRRGRFVFVNRYADGLDEQQVLGRTVYDFLAPSSAAPLKRAVGQVFRTGRPARLLTQGLAQSGGIAWYENRLSAIKRGGRVTYVVLIASDITDETLIQSRFEGLFNSSRDAMTYVTLDGTLLEVNPAYERMTGYKREELVLRKRYQDLTPDEYRESDRTAIETMLRSGKPVEIEKEWLRKDGSRIPIRLTVFPVIGPDGRTAAQAAIAKDITEEKRLQKEILEAGAREQSKLGRDLHDTLGQTLTGLSLLAKSLKSGLEARGAEEASEASRLAELSSLAVKQARGLARSLLPGEIQQSGLPDALRKLASSAEELFGIRCRVNAPPERLGLPEAAAIQLYRIAQEAVHNAAKHARSTKGVVIRLTATQTRLRLEIADFGVGIRRPDERTRGLGLGVMEHRARMLGGSLAVKRRPGGGTAVICSCPRQQKALQAST